MNKLLIILVAAASVISTSTSGNAQTFTDPDAYCRVVRTIDVPDNRYTGPAVTPAMAAAFNTTVQELEIDRGGGVKDSRLEWRCMNGVLLACVTLNSPECEKQSVSVTQNMQQFCQRTPNENIPASVAGRSPVQWKCDGQTPKITKTFGKIDARGFNEGSWKSVIASEQRPRDRSAVSAASATSGPEEKSATVSGAGSTESARIKPISPCVKTDGFDIFGLKLGMTRRNLPTGLQFARDDSWSTVAVVDSGRPGPIPTLATRAANLGRLYVHLTGPHMPGEPKVFMIYLETFQLGRFERNENAAEILINKFGCPSSQTPGAELTWNLPAALGTGGDIFFAMRPWERPLSPNADRMPNGIVMAQVQTDLGSGIGTFANVILVDMPLLAQNYRSYLAAKAAAVGRANSAERNRARNTASPF